MQIDHQKGSLVSAGLIVGEGVRGDPSLQIDIEHAPAVNRVRPFRPSLDNHHPAQFPGVHRIPVPSTTPSGLRSLNRAWHQYDLLSKILPLVRVDIAGEA